MRDSVEQVPAWTKDPRHTNIRTVTVEMVRSGQPRPYADSFYEALLTFSTPQEQMFASKWPVSIEQVKPFVQVMVHGFSENPAWHEARLETLEEVEPRKWRVVVVRPYLD